jgi:RNA polymerase sigma-70 factor (ECF subfamily)
MGMSQQNGLFLTAELRATLLKVLPHLRAFAISLCGNVDQADDLVQDTIVRGLSYIDKFEPGTNMQAWLFTILRNQFHTSFRRKRHEVEDPDGIMAGMLSTLPEQHGHLDLDDLQTALGKLSVVHREVLLLIGAEGLSYEETAQIVGTSIGTVKSRMNRARARLAELLNIEDEGDLGTDRVIRAALTVEANSRTGIRKDSGGSPSFVS